MNQLGKVIIISCVAVLVFDAIGAIASTFLGFQYALLSVGSVLVYSLAGFLGTKYGNIKSGLLVSAIVGLIDATLGWAISWIIGPGKIAAQSAGLIEIIFTVVSVTLMAIAFGLIGGIIEKALNAVQQRTVKVKDTGANE